MIHVDRQRSPRDLAPKIARLFELSAGKIRSIEQMWRPADGAPVFTVNGRYQARGWTEWTQGFQFGSALLQFDATGDADFLELGRARTSERMAPHLTHVGVHDHGFTNVSTYGNLWRLARETRIEVGEWERRWRLAITTSTSLRRTACRTGTPARRGSPRSTSGAIGPPIPSTIASRSTVPPPRLRRRDCCGSVACSRRAAPPPIGRATSRRAFACSTR